MDEPSIDPVQVITEEQPESLLDQLAAKREAVSSTKETILPLPGYDRTPPFLHIKYRLLDSKEIGQLATKVNNQFRDRWERALFLAVDTVIAACVGFYYSETGNATDVKPLTIGEQPVTRFSAALAEGLKFADKLEDAKQPRNVVLGLFGQNDVALQNHVFLLNRWMADTSIDVSQGLLGNL
jgi:hypothetical protein